MEFTMHPWIPRRLTGLCLLLALAGCSEALPPEDDRPTLPVSGSRFDPVSCGTIRGQVVWQGEIARVPPLVVLPNPLAGPVFQKRQTRANPNAPAIDVWTRGVQSAVVFLRGVDAEAGKPWDLAPVRVEQRDCQFRVFQGEESSQVGFLRRGDPVEMVSRDSYFHALRASGSTFFSLMFPDPDQPLSRQLYDRGVVELSSAAGYYWMRGYLFIDDHPYYARTDVTGHFELTRVPPGRYDLVCWLPSWIKARSERDPEMGVISRLFFQPPLEQVQPVALRPGETVTTVFQLSNQTGMQSSTAH
jgi:hypothetical protein